MVIALLAVKVKMRVARGQSWLSYFNLLFYLGGIANYRTLVSNPIIAYVTGLGYFFMCYCIGYYDEVYGIWKLEAEYGTKNLNPFMEKLDKKIDILLERK